MFPSNLNTLRLAPASGVIMAVLAHEVPGVEWSSYYDAISSKTVIVGKMPDESEHLYFADPVAFSRSVVVDGCMDMVHRWIG